MRPLVALLLAPALFSVVASAQAAARPNFFCEHKLYDIGNFDFISQPAPNEYLIVKGDDYYRANWTGNQFDLVPDGPHRLADTFPGLNSFGPPGSSASPSTPTKFLLFVSQPNESQAALQFVGNQIWLWRGPGTSLRKVQPPPNCPASFTTLVHRSVQPHLMVIGRNYLNLTFDLAGDGKLNCSPAEAIFREVFDRGFAVDAPLSGMGTDPRHLFSTKVYEWRHNGLLYEQKLDPYRANLLPTEQHWTLFHCPDPKAKSLSLVLLAGIVVGSLLALVLIGLLIYWATVALMRTHKKEVSKIALNSQIE